MQVISDINNKRLIIVTYLSQKEQYFISDSIRKPARNFADISYVKQLLGPELYEERCEHVSLNMCILFLSVYILY